MSFPFLFCIGIPGPQGLPGAKGEPGTSFTMRHIEFGKNDTDLSYNYRSTSTTSVAIVPWSTRWKRWSRIIRCPWLTWISSMIRFLAIIIFTISFSFRDLPVYQVYQAHQDRKVMQVYPVSQVFQDPKELLVRGISPESKIVSNLNFSLF